MMPSLIIRRNPCYLVLRDVSKAFDKVWHEGLQYKIALLNHPDTFTKLFNNFITEREAKIKIGTYIDPAFPHMAGVPQGSALSPTLYTIYTADIPPPAIYCTTFQYADDITQIITYRGKPRQMMTRWTQRKIRENKYLQK